MNKKIKDKLLLLPNLPGSYQMKDENGVIIYVGKAKNLKKRVTSYFKGHHTGKTAKLVQEIDDFEYIVVNSELESLILEINLIKKYTPKYNILLKDDKTYPYIELSNDKTPKLTVIRQINRKKNTHNLYGPYPNVSAARNTVNLLNRIYPLRKCQHFEKKPCLYYHIGQCLGYCTHNIDQDKINQMKEDIILFLKGDSTKIIKKLTTQMNEYSEQLEFEKAKEIKQTIEYINITLKKQEVELNDNIDRDIFGFYEYKGYLSIQIFFIRNSKIIERHGNIIPLIDNIEEELTRYIANFYNKDIKKPKEILVPKECDIELLKNYLNTKIKTPYKGEKKHLIDLAKENAKISLHEQIELINKDEIKTIEANEELREILNLKKLNRIEIFDNSHLFGTFNVSGMVVFINGKPAKKEYRKYKISSDKNDDYGTMKELIYRRYFRVLKDNLEKPDLIIVDGGIGQINVARTVLNELYLDIPVIGLKKNTSHATDALLANEPIQEINIDKKSNVFYLLERMQDEVHNFTINYHKEIRSKGAIASILDNVYGIGPKYKKALIKKFHTINQIEQATNEELEEILPKNVANKLITYLKNYHKKS